MFFKKHQFSEDELKLYLVFRCAWLFRMQSVSTCRPKKQKL